MQVFFADLKVVHAIFGQPARLGPQGLRLCVFVSRKEGTLGNGIEKHLRAN